MANYFSLNNVDDDELSHKKREEEAIMVARVLSQDYANVYLINPGDATVEVRKQDGFVAEDIENGSFRRFPYDQIWRKYIDSRVFSEDREPLYEAGSLKNVLEIMKLQNKYKYNYRTLENGVIHHFQLNFFKLDDGRLIAGFKNVDATLQYETGLRKKIEEELEVANKKVRRDNSILRVLTRDVTNLYILNIKSGEIEVLRQNSAIVEEVERGLVKTLNYEEAWEKFCREFVHPEDRQELYEAGHMKNVLRILETKSEFSYNYRSITYGIENCRPYQVKFQYISEDEVLISGQDISAIVEKERQMRIIQNALSQAEHANRAKTDFLNSISHDIRTPMNAIMGFTELAMRHIDDKEKSENYLKKIRSSSTHLLGLINEVLDMSSIEAGKMKIEEGQVDLTELLKDLRNMVLSDIKKKNQILFFDYADIKDNIVVCDKLHLNQILLNCISNAIKYTHEEGTIGVKVTQIPVVNEGYGHYQFKIRDNGIGMSEEFLTHIFEPFEREKSSTISGIQGTGLGMTITKILVENMGGSISAESKKGEGSEFTIEFEFKLMDSKGISDQEITKQEYESVLRGKRLLIVEDNEFNLEIAVELFSDLGAIVDTAENGLVAMEKVRDQAGGTYDCVLMDIQMPVMDGYEATRLIRKLDDRRKACVPIIAMTANAFEEDRKRAIKAGMNEHVTKPIVGEAALSALKRVFMNI